MAKIVILHQGGSPFLAVPLRETIRSMVQRGHDVRVCLLGLSSLTQSCVLPIESRSVEPETVPGASFCFIQLASRRISLGRVGWALKFFEFWVRQLLFAWKNRADVVIAFNGETLFAGWLASKLSGSRLVYYADELSAERNQAGQRIWSWFDRHLARHSDMVVCCNRSRAKQLQSRSGLTDLPVVVPNVSAWQDLPHNNYLEDYVAQHGGPADSRVLVYQGAIHKQRCIATLVESLAELDPHVVLVLFGYALPEYRHELEQLATRLGVANRLFFHPFVERKQLLNCTASADVGLMLINPDCFNAEAYAPCKLFEYWMAGLPVIASDLPELRPWFEDPMTGLLLTEQTPQSLAKAVQQLIGEPTNLRAMSNHVRQLARLQWNWDVQAAQFIDRLEELIKKTQRQRE